MGYKMLRRYRFFLLVAFLACFFHAEAAAQSADNRSPLTSPADEDENGRPKSIRETIERMRIEKEKKEFDEMIGRGEEAVRISEELEKALERDGKLATEQLTKVAAVEKLVKKIRSELGGDDDDEKNAESAKPDAGSSSREIVRNLRSTAVKLLEELKKTSRFTVSAAAIQASNSVLRIARFLRIAR